jgi:hypothetical protein
MFSVIEWSVFGVPNFFVTKVTIEVWSLKAVRVHTDYPTTSSLRFGLERPQEPGSKLAPSKRGCDPQPLDHRVATPTEAIDSGVELTLIISKKATHGSVLVVPSCGNIERNQSLAQFGYRRLVMDIRDLECSHHHHAVRRLMSSSE